MEVDAGNRLKVFMKVKVLVSVRTIFWAQEFFCLDAQSARAITRPSLASHLLLLFGHNCTYA
jgi:hypothetical protein